jgi:hypothetical protein
MNRGLPVTLIVSDLTSLRSQENRRGMYQTMIGLERREDGALWRERFYPALPARFDVPRLVMSAPATDFWPGAAVSSRAAVRLPASGMAVAGTPESPFTYLAVSRERTMSRGTCAVAEGALTARGLTVGLLRNGPWYRQANIVDPGRFVAGGCVEEAGAYSVVIANNNPPGGKTSAQLTRIGWVSATGAASRD